MKKRYFLFMLFVIFAFVPCAKAFELSCDNSTVNQGDYVTCRITKVDTEQGESINVYSDLEIYESDIPNPTLKDGKIKFSTRHTTDNSYNISAESNINGVKTKTIKVKGKTTTTTKTTTKTTTTKSKSDNNYLSIITIDGEKIKNFSKNTTKYFVDVDFNVKKISLKAEAEDDKSKVDIDGPTNLKVGVNEYTISVTSEADSTKYYKVIVTKKEEGKSSNTDIKSIKIRKYHLNFDKSSKTFYLKIDKETTELDITVKLKDKNASYDVEDNDNLKDGSVVKIVVTAEDGTTDTYRIIIEKKASNYMPIIVITSLVIITVIVIIIMSKKKKNNGKKQKEDLKNKHSDEKEDVTQKTIEMPPISDDNESAEDEEFEQDYKIDNDEEEKTRILSYAELKELEQEKDNIKDEEIKSKLDEELNGIDFNYNGYLPDDDDEDDY